MKVLTIGNSFSGNATEQMLDLLSVEDDIDLTIGRADLGGCSLSKHWNLVEQCDLLSEVKPYNFHLLGEKTIPMTLREALSYMKWDYVTLQQVSTESWQPETFIPYIDNLHALINELAPQAQPILHQTWSYRTDGEILKEFKIDQIEMYKHIVQNYNNLSKHFDCRILPSGTAIQKARPEMNFEIDSNYDYNNPTPLQLPDQSKSLIIGYQWSTGNTSTGKAELNMDYRHLNNKGCYIANAVWFEMFTGKKIADNTYIPPFLSSEELTLFKKVAHEAVVEYGGSL
jgi:hypothetical protein